MSKQTIEIGRFATKTENEYLVVEVDYTKGGTNFLSGNSYSRGYYAGVHVRTIRPDGSVSFLIGGGPKGYSMLIEKADRFNAKKLAQLAEAYKPQLSYLVGMTLDRNPGMELAQVPEGWDKVETSVA